jgi:hypothetical protein
MPLKAHFGKRTTNWKSLSVMTVRPTIPLASWNGIIPWTGESGLSIKQMAASRAL